MRIEFSNSSSTEWFGSDFSEALDSNLSFEREIASQELNAQRFVLIEYEDDASMYEPDNDETSWRLNALRAQLNTDMSANGEFNSSNSLLSLKDIILESKAIGSQKEIYVKLKSCDLSE